MTPAVVIIANDDQEAAELDKLRRNCARHLSKCADDYRAAGDDEMAARFDAAALRFDPQLIN